MIVLGLTGGVGMGKSTAARMLETFGAKISNADAIVHALMGKDGDAVEEIEALFPGVMKGGAVDRKALGAIVFRDKKKMRELEAILHPLVMLRENEFLRQQKRLGAKLAVLDIPLLYETGGEKRCDLVMVVSAPEFIQRQRVMQRPGMTEEKFAAIVASQMPDREKRRRADWVVETGLGRAHTFRRIATLMGRLHVA